MPEAAVSGWRRRSSGNISRRRLRLLRRPSAPALNESAPAFAQSPRSHDDGPPQRTYTPPGPRAAKQASTNASLSGSGDLSLSAGVAQTLLNENNTATLGVGTFLAGDARSAAAAAAAAAAAHAGDTDTPSNTFSQTQPSALPPSTGAASPTSEVTRSLLRRSLSRHGKAAGIGLDAEPRNREEASPGTSLTRLRTASARFASKNRAAIGASVESPKTSIPSSREPETVALTDAIRGQQAGTQQDSAAPSDDTVDCLDDRSSGDMGELASNVAALGLTAVDRPHAALSDAHRASMSQSDTNGSAGLRIGSLTESMPSEDIELGMACSEEKESDSELNQSTWPNASSQRAKLDRTGPRGDRGDPAGDGSLGSTDEPTMSRASDEYDDLAIPQDIPIVSTSSVVRETPSNERSHRASLPSHVSGGTRLGHGAVPRSSSLRFALVGDSDAEVPQAPLSTAATDPAVNPAGPTWAVHEARVHALQAEVSATLEDAKRRIAAAERRAALSAETAVEEYKARALRAEDEAKATSATLKDVKNRLLRRIKDLEAELDAERVRAEAEAENHAKTQAQMGMEIALLRGKRTSGAVANHSAVGPGSTAASTIGNVPRSASARASTSQIPRPSPQNAKQHYGDLHRSLSAATGTDPLRPSSRSAVDRASASSTITHTGTATNTTTGTSSASSGRHETASTLVHSGTQGVPLLSGSQSHRASARHESLRAAVLSRIHSSSFRNMRAAWYDCFEPSGTRLAPDAFRAAVRRMPGVPIDARDREIDDIRDEMSGGAVDGVLTWTSFVRFYQKTKCEVASVGR